MTYEEFLQTPLGKLMTAQQVGRAPEMSRQEMLKMMQKGPKKRAPAAPQEQSPFDEMRPIDGVISANTGSKIRDIAHKLTPNHLPMFGPEIPANIITTLLEGNLEPSLGTASDMTEGMTGLDFKDMLRAGMKNKNATAEDITKKSAIGGLSNAAQAAAIEFGGPLVKGALTEAFPVLGKPVGELLGLGKKVMAGGKPGILSAIEKDASNPSGTHYVDHGDGSPMPYKPEEVADEMGRNLGTKQAPYNADMGIDSKGDTTSQSHSDFISVDRPDINRDDFYGNSDPNPALRKVFDERQPGTLRLTPAGEAANRGLRLRGRGLASDPNAGPMFDPEQFGGDRPEPAAEDLISPDPEFTPDTRSPEQRMAEGPNERLRRAAARQQEVEAISRQLRGREPRSFGGDMGTQGGYLGPGRANEAVASELFAGPRGPAEFGGARADRLGERRALGHGQGAAPPAFQAGTIPPEMQDAMGRGIPPEYDTRIPYLIADAPGPARRMIGPRSVSSIGTQSGLPEGLDSQQMAARDATGALGEGGEGPGLFRTPPEREPLMPQEGERGSSFPDDGQYHGVADWEQLVNDWANREGPNPAIGGGPELWSADPSFADTHGGQNAEDWDGTPGGVHPTFIDPTDEATWPSAMGPDQPTGPNFPPGMKGPGEPGYIPPEISGNDPNAGLRPTVNPLERMATAAVEKFKAVAQGQPGMAQTMAKWTDGIAHSLISGFGQSRSAMVQFNKGYHGPMEMIWDLAHSHFTDALGLPPEVADNIKDALQGSLVWDTLAPEQQQVLRDAVEKFNPVVKEIKAMSQYLLDTGRVTAEEMQQHGDMYMRRHLAMFDAATRDGWRPPADSVEPAIQALLREYNYEGGIQSRQHAMEVMANWEKAAHDGGPIHLPDGRTMPVTMGNGSIFMQKTDLPPEVLKWMGELTHGGLGLLRTMGDMASTVHAARTADGIFSHLDQIRMESPSEPAFGNGRKLGDALNASDTQRRILGPLADEVVPRAVGEMFQNVFGMQDGSYRLVNQYLRGIRLGTMGLNPATHAMWAMNDMASMTAAGVNPMNPMNAPHILKASQAVAAYHIPANHPVWGSIADKIPGFSYADFVAEHRPVYEQLRDAGAFKGAGRLKLEATHTMAEAFHDLMIGNGHETPGSQAATFLNAPIAATERVPGLGYMLKLGPEIMEGTSQIQQAAVVLKGMDGIRLKDFGAPIKMSLDDAILHKNDFFYQSQETGQMLRQMKTGPAGVVNAIRGFSGINYTMDVMTKQLPNTLGARPNYQITDGVRRAYLQRPLAMAGPALMAVAFHNWGWTMGGFAHQFTEGAGVPEGFNPFIKPEDAKRATADAARESYKYRFPHGFWEESPFKSPFGGEPSKANLANGLPEYMLFGYERKLGNTTSEDLGGWAASVAKDSLLGGGNFASRGDVDQGAALGRNKNMSALLNMAGNTQPGHLIRSGRDVYDALSGAPMSRFNYNEGPTRVMLRALANIDAVSSRESVMQGKLDAAHTEHEIAGGARAIKLEARKRGEDPAETKAKQDVNKARIQRAQEMRGEE